MRRKIHSVVPLTLAKQARDVYKRQDELSEHFRLMEGIWDEYRVYVGKDRV